MSKDREANLSESSQPTAKRRTLVVGLPLPPEIQSVHEDTRCIGPQTPSGRVSRWPANHDDVAFIDSTALIARPLTFGFLAARKKVRLDCEIRVYPNLFTERKNLAPCFFIAVCSACTRSGK